MDVIRRQDDDYAVVASDGVVLFECASLQEAEEWKRQQQAEEYFPKRNDRLREIIEGRLSAPLQGKL